MTLKVNGGTIQTTHKAYVKEYGGVWFDERSITKILALNKVKSKFIVTYGINSDGLLTVHNTSRQDVQFNMHKYGLNYHNTNNYHIYLVKTLSNNEADYRKLQLKSAKLAIEIYYKSGHPSHKYFNNLIKYDIISNFPVNL